MAIVPEMVRARTDPPPSATVRSPDTVAADRSPLMAEGLDRARGRLGLGRAAERGQGDLAETVLASTGAAARQRPGWPRRPRAGPQSRGTASDSTALRLPLLVSQAPSPGRHGRS